VAKCCKRSEASVLARNQSGAGRARDWECRAAFAASMSSERQHGGALVAAHLHLTHFSPPRKSVFAPSALPAAQFEEGSSPEATHSRPVSRKRRGTFAPRECGGTRPASRASLARSRVVRSRPARHPAARPFPARSGHAGRLGRADDIAGVEDGLGSTMRLQLPATREQRPGLEFDPRRAGGGMRCQCCETASAAERECDPCTAPPAARVLAMVP